MAVGESPRIFPSDKNVLSYDLAIGLVITSILFSIYALTFNGKLTSIDELAIYNQAESLVQIKSLSTPQLSFAPYHNKVGSLEPLYSIFLAIPYALARSIPGISNIHAAMLVPLLLTASTGGLLYLIARKIDYPCKVSSIIAFVYGLATLAWPYALSLYREPLLAFLWTFTLYGILKWKENQSRIWGTIVLATIVCTVQVKVTAAAAFPVLMLVLLSDIHLKKHTRVFYIVSSLAILSAVSAFVIRYDQLSPLLSALRNLSPSSETLSGLYGLTLNPGKGIVFFSPVVIVALAGIPGLWHRSRTVAFVCAGFLASVLYAYSNYSVWHGGWCWGPRFLVPLMPLVSLLTGPLLNQATLNWIAWPFIFVSGIIQFAASTMDWSNGYSPLVKSEPLGQVRYNLSLTEWFRSPVITQIRRWRLQEIDLLWAHRSLSGTFELDATLAGVLFLCAIIATILFVMTIHTRRSILSVLAIPLIIVASVAILERGVNNMSGFPGLKTEQATQIAKTVNSNSQDFVLATVSNEFGIHYYTGLIKGRFVHHWLSPAQHKNFTNLLQPRLPAKELWLVVDYPHLPPEFSGKDLEWTLNADLYRASAQWIGGFLVIRYFYPLDSLTWETTSWQWENAITLDRYALSDKKTHPGKAIRMAFELRRVGPWIGYHHLFVHLVSPEGKIIGGHDGPIRYGGVAADSWSVGAKLVERRAFILPEELPPGSYQLVIGIETPEGFLEARNGEVDSKEIIPLETLQVVESPFSEQANDQ